MKIKIAVFGRKNTIERMQRLLPEDEVEMLPFVYSRAEETARLFDTVFNCDIYVFTEYLSYLYVKEIIDKKRLPVIPVEVDPYRMVAALYRLQTEMDQPPKRIAIDLFNDRYLDELAEELGFAEDEIHGFLHNPSKPPNVEEVISYYTDLWNEKKIDYVLASTEEIVSALNSSGIPAGMIEIPDLQLKKIIDQAIQRVKLGEFENNQIVTGFVSIKGINEQTTSEEQRIDSIQTLKRILTRFAARTDTFFTETWDHRLIIYGTDKLMKHLKEHYRSFPLLQEMKNSIKLPVHLGFGLGLNASESAKNAEIALDNCMHSEHSICYIVNERQEIIGPIGVKREIDTSSLYRALIHDARLNNELSYNFIDFITERNNEPFSTNDIALFYNVTKRSAERTVNKLLNGKVIKIAGEERPYKKGRPRKLFTLNQ